MKKSARFAINSLSIVLVFLLILACSAFDDTEWRLETIRTNVHTWSISCDVVDNKLLT